MDLVIGIDLKLHAFVIYSQPPHKFGTGRYQDKEGQLRVSRVECPEFALSEFGSCPVCYLACTDDQKGAIYPITNRLTTPQMHAISVHNTNRLLAALLAYARRLGVALCLRPIDYGRLRQTPFYREWRP